MPDNHSRRIDERIVSLHQPHVHPIVHGKAGHETEFEAKLTASMKVAICKCFVNVTVPERDITRKLFWQINCSATGKICDIAQNMGSDFPARVSDDLQKS